MLSLLTPIMPLPWRAVKGKLTQSAPVLHMREGERALTPREREVLDLVAQGLTTPRIANELGIRPSTVRTHVEHAREKLGARTRAEAVARCNKLVDTHSVGGRMTVSTT